MMSSTATSSTSGARDFDARGFVYALEPVRQRQQWNLDKAMAALAQAQKQLSETEARLVQLMASHDEQAELLGKALQQRLDPIAHRRNLAYLANLRDQWHVLDRAREEQRNHRDSLRDQCIRQQVKLDGLAQHKEDALAQYGDEMRKRDLNEQDRDWLARSVTARTPANVQGQTL
jgi:hypothetical protein